MQTKKSQLQRWQAVWEHEQWTERKQNQEQWMEQWLERQQKMEQAQERTKLDQANRNSRMRAPSLPVLLSFVTKVIRTRAQARERKRRNTMT